MADATAQPRRCSANKFQNDGFFQKRRREPITGRAAL